MKRLAFLDDLPFSEASKLMYTLVPSWIVANDWVMKFFGRFSINEWKMSKCVTLNDWKILIDV